MDSTEHLLHAKYHARLWKYSREQDRHHPEALVIIYVVMMVDFRTTFSLWVIGLNHLHANYQYRLMRNQRKSNGDCGVGFPSIFRRDAGRNSIFSIWPLLCLDETPGRPQPFCNYEGRQRRMKLDNKDGRTERLKELGFLNVVFKLLIFPCLDTSLLLDL